MYHSIKGIAGNAIQSIKNLEIEDAASDNFDEDED
jgi:hypothetical protein